jgi:hypothetical protein
MSVRSSSKVTIEVNGESLASFICDQFAINSEPTRSAAICLTPGMTCVYTGTTTFQLSRSPSANGGW